MKISQKLEYTCRALAQLARQEGGQKLTRLDELAQREAISSSFLVQIFHDLKRAGLVESRRGKTGGYSLAKKPEHISLAEIVQAIEPQLLQSTVASDGECGARVRSVWQTLSTQFEECLQETSLAKLAQGDEEPMFYI